MRKSSTKKTEGKRWSAQVTAHSDALDLKNNLFRIRNPVAIAQASIRASER